MSDPLAHRDADHSRHCQDQQRDSGGDTDPKTAGEINQFMRWLIAGDLGLQCHAADRAGAGEILPNFRVHWTGVNRASRGGFHDPRGVARSIEPRVCVKFRTAPGRAKVEILPIKRRRAGIRAQIYCHAADRIDSASLAKFGTFGRAVSVPVVRIIHGAVIRLTVFACVRRVWFFLRARHRERRSRCEPYTKNSVLGIDPRQRWVRLCRHHLFATSYTAIASSKDTLKCTSYRSSPQSRLQLPRNAGSASGRISESPKRNSKYFRGDAVMWRGATRAGNC